MQFPVMIDRMAMYTWAALPISPPVKPSGQEQGKITVLAQDLDGVNGCIPRVLGDRVCYLDCGE